MVINLIVQYFKCGNEARQKEIDTCLVNNLSNGLISRIHLLTEQLFDVSRFPHHEKIMQTVIGERLTYEAAFRHANQHSDNQIWILSNADIYFDESLACLVDAKLDGVVFALTRHDVQEDGTSRIVIPAFAHGCQDAWIFKTPFSLDKIFAKFYLGIPGCDGRIAYEFIQAGYKVINPSKKIIMHHLDLAREKGILERDREYGLLLSSDECIKQGLAVPPPYQYHIYPVDQVDPNGLEMYKFYLSMLDGYGKTSQCLEIMNEQYNSLLQSRSWKVTKPLRMVARFFSRLKDN